MFYAKYVFLFSVAYGACVQAAVLGRKPCAPSIYVQNVTPLTIGAITANNLKPCKPMIKRNSSYPTESVMPGRSINDNQTSALVELYEGEHKTRNGNVILGEMVLCGIPKAVKGETIVDVSLNIDEKGSISASVTDRKMNRTTKLSIQKEFQFNEGEIAILNQSLVELPEVILNWQNPKDEKDEDFNIVKAVESMNKRRKIEKDDEDKPKDKPDDVCPIYGEATEEVIETEYILEVGQ